MSDAVLFRGGRVFTGRRYCDALIIENGTVVAAGTDAEAARAAPTGVERRDLDGALLLPGLVDAHFHVADVTRLREGLDLSSSDSHAVLADAIGRWATDHPSGLIVGCGWDPERFPGREWPTCDELDRAAPGRRTVVLHVSGHAAVASSAALAAAGFGTATPDPTEGRFGRAEGGTLDGRLYEGAVRILIDRCGGLESPAPDALRRTLRWAAKLGLTSVGAMSAMPEEAAALRELSRAGTLPVRVRVYLAGSRWEEYFRVGDAADGPPGRFAVIGVKEYTDGAFGPRTAWLREPYADDPTTSGMPRAERERLRVLLEAVARRGLAPALHAIGDRAVEYALEILAAVPRTGGPPPRIEHAALTPPWLFGALARTRPALVVQPGFLWSDHWLRSRLGPARARWAYAFRTLQDQGHLLVGSSDAPYDPVDPWRGVRAAVERTDPEGRSANPAPEEALRPEEAIALYTRNAGTAFGETGLGSLEPGSPADLLVFAAPSLAGAIATGSAGVRETWVGGVRATAEPSPRASKSV
ncbi:MAG: amidohydrolase [Thermoplasmata archaeon]